MSEASALGRLIEYFGQPKVIRRFNGWMTIFWICWFVPAIAVGSFRRSVFLVALYSIYANLVSHYTAWIASRAEVRAENVENIEGENVDVRNAEKVIGERSGS